MRHILRLSFLALVSLPFGANTVAQSWAFIDPPPGCTVPGGGGNFGVCAVFLDFDGDGNLDVGVGQPGRGAAYIFYGPYYGTWQAITKNGLMQPGLRPPVDPSEDFGFALDAIAIDGTAGEELIIGAPLAAGGVGRVYYVGAALAIQTLNTSLPGAVKLGTAVAGGDFDGDGTVDIAAGAPYTVVGGVTGAGTLHIFRGPSAQEVVIGNPGVASGEALNGAFASVMSADDSDGDGRHDLIASAQGNDASGVTNAGQVVYFPHPVQANRYVSIVDPAPMAGDQPGPRFGKKLSVRDGLLTVGAPRKDTPGGAIADAGGGFLFSGTLYGTAFQFANPAPETNGLFGFNTILADVVGDQELDFVFVKQKTQELFIWDHHAPAGRPVLVPTPAGSVYLLSLDAAQERPGGKEELLIGDFKYNSFVGRVMIARF